MKRMGRRFYTLRSPSLLSPFYETNDRLLLMLSMKLLICDPSDHVSHGKIASGIVVMAHFANLLFALQAFMC